MIKIDKIVPGGQALGTDSSGKKGFFWNALPGEEVTDFIVTKNKSHYFEAIATAVNHPSPHRVSPLDDCCLSTSPWQIMDYAYELELKTSLVMDIFQSQSITISQPKIITDHHDYHYRNKMEYALYWDNTTSKISLAFHARGSHRKIPITHSSLERPEIFTAATKIIDDLNASHAEARRYQSLLLRCNQRGKVSGGLFENGKPHPVFPALSDSLLGHSYSYSPNGFFQINLPVYELALQEIKKHITTDQVLDLYAGVGTIGLSVAAGKNLTLVEVDKAAFSELTKNATSIEGPRPTTILSKSEDALKFITANQTVILDPPRSGCDHKLIEQLLTSTPETIIYLSCNPITQARDISLLSSKYHISSIQTFNFFPHTPHIENLVILMKK